MFLMSEDVKLRRLHWFLMFRLQTKRPGRDEMKEQIVRLPACSCLLAAQPVCLQRVCTGAKPARVAAGPAVRALPARVPLSHPAVRELPLPRGHHQVGVRASDCRQGAQCSPCV